MTDSELSTQMQLFNYVYTGDIAKLQQMIRRGVDVNVREEIDSTAIHLAAAERDSEIVRLLLDAGAHLNGLDPEGHTPFHIAVLFGNIEVARFLLEVGAEINTFNETGTTPLHTAAKKGNVEMTHFLIDAGADLNAENQFGETPFHSAAYARQFEVACLLIDAGSDFSDATNVFYLHVMCPRSKAFFLKHLLKLRCLGLHVSERHMSYLRKRYVNRLRMFKKQCETEVANMKGHVIREGYRFNLCDMLTKREDELRKLLQVEEVRLKVREAIREMPNPAYRNMISMKFTRIVKAVEYIVKARRIIGFIVSSVKYLPEECVDKIASYFTDKDMRVLVYRFK